MSRPLVVVGDVVLDRDLEGTVERVCPDAPVPVVDAPAARSRPGGAGLAAALAANDADVVLVAALAQDDAGREVARLLERAGIELVPLRLDGTTPEKVRVRASGQSLLRVDHGGPPGPVGAPDARARRVVSAAGALLVSDYGRGVAAQVELRDLVRTAAARTPLVWDPHVRGPAPVPGVRLATPNQMEASRLANRTSAADGTAGAAASARALATRWSATAVAVTLGERGAVVAGPDGSPLVVPAEPVAHVDPCGAGDRFASAAALALAGGALPTEAVEEAVWRSSAFVASGGAAAFASSLHQVPAPEPGQQGPGGHDPEALVRQVRRSGGTVVATGGCFDLLHAGHLSLLRAARSLGDCLVVCLNSDASVRRLKGADRPIQQQDDRAALLLALGCVDAVAVFDEDTPVALLDRLRPDLFAKGADYRVADLPEARALARWGGQAVLLPYLRGRSTSRLQEATRHGHGQ